MTARNVRAYQTKGLIPPPARSGRRSVYGLEHLQRLQAIERARRKGASLTLIAAHLAAGRSLDDETLIDWADPAEGSPPVAASPQDIAPLLGRLDIQRDAAAQAHVEELIRAGIFRPEAERVYTGRELAEALIAFQREGYPLKVALGTAQRVLGTAVPVAASLQEAVRAFDGPAAATCRLGDVACGVLRHLLAQAQATSNAAGQPD